MSGIVGIYSPEGRPVDLDLLRAMLRCIGQRGPDGEGVWTDGGVGLGHRLLHTTPESLSEQQPLLSGDGTLCLIADARVDNREELAEALRARGLVPRGDSDAALILGAYEAWGEDCPARILGDFSFALWDGRRQQLFCARDPLGIKPFYYTSDADGFRWASTEGGLHAGGALPWKPNLRLMLLWLLVRFDEQEETLDQHVYRLPAGHCLVVRAGQLRKRCYWNPTAVEEVRFRTDQEYADHFLHLFRDAVRVRLRSAGPVAAQLSGGLDSSSVVCLANRLQREDISTGPLHAHGLAHHGYPCDEKEYMEAVATEEGVPTQVHEYEEERAWADLDRASDFPDVYFLPTLFLQGVVLQTARGQGARVLLTGVGGDDLMLLGPELLTDLWRECHWRTLGTRLCEESGFFGLSPRALFERYCLRPSVPFWFKRATRPMKRWLRGQGLPTWIEPASLGRLGVPLYLDAPKLRFSSWNQQALYEGLAAGWAANGALPALEHFCSHFGLEPRHPFLDRRLVEFALALPPEQRRKGTRTKRVLRRAMRGILPERIRARTNKAEFSCIVDREFAVRQAAGIAQLFSRSVLADLGIVRREEASRLLVEYQRDPSASTFRRACQFLVFLEVWLRVVAQNPTREFRQ